MSYLKGRGRTSSINKAAHPIEHTVIIEDTKHGRKYGCA